MAADPRCRVCGGDTVPLGRKHCAFSGRTYGLRQCRACWFAFVEDPWTEYDRIYTDDYYAGRGADPHVDYVDEFDHPDSTVRQYEWRGIVAAVNALVPAAAGARWLDYGCGNGGLVRYARGAGHPHAVGYDTGAMAARARGAGLPILTDDELREAAGTFDIVTAIEVIEHVPDPVAVLSAMRRLLVPGGLLFVTTGNARPFRERLLSWRYVLPDVHVSFFEPGTLARAMDRAGFRAEQRGRLPGYVDIIRFKVLKALTVRRRHAVERMLPWTLVSRLVDARYAVSAHPIGWAR